MISYDRCVPEDLDPAEWWKPSPPEPFTVPADYDPFAYEPFPFEPTED